MSDFSRDDTMGYCGSKTHRQETWQTIAQKVALYVLINAIVLVFKRSGQTRALLHFTKVVVVVVLFCLTFYILSYLCLFLSFYPQVLILPHFRTL